MSFLINTFLFSQNEIETDTTNIEKKDSVEKDYPLELYYIASIFDTQRIRKDTLNYFGDVTNFHIRPGLNNIGSPVTMFNPDEYYAAYGHGLKSSYPYYYFIDNFSFIYPNKTLTEINFKQGRSIINSQTTFQNNYNLHLIFAHTFKNNLNFNLRYNKLNHQGIYSNQRQKHSALATGIRYQSKNEKFNLQMIYIWNLSKSEESNGITDDSLLAVSNYRIRNSIPVFSSALKNINDQQIGLSYQYQIKSRNPIFNPALRLYHKYSEFRFGYIDRNANSASAIYRYLYLDSSLLGVSFIQDVVTNGLRLDLLQLKQFNLGGDVRFDYVVNDFDTASFSNKILYISFFSNLKFIKSLPIQARYTFVQKENRTAQMLDAYIEYQHGNKWDTRVSYFLNQYFPTEIEERFFVNKISVRDQQLSLPAETGIQIRWRATRKNIPEINFTYSNFFNFIAYDSSGILQQREKLLQSIRLQFSHTLQWRWLFLKNHGNLQTYLPDAFNLNNWSTEHEIGVQLKLFKSALLFKASLYAQLLDTEKQLQFQAPTGIFYASGTDFKPYMTNGVRLKINVLSFEGHLDFDYLDSLWNKNRPSVVQFYPLYDFYVRFGIRWRLFY